MLGCAVQSVFAQPAPAGPPEENGLYPVGPTTYLHYEGSVFNDNLEGSLGVAIASNGNVMVGWEDDGSNITDFEANWTIVKPDGSFVTPDTTINSTVVTGGPIQTRFLSFFRADGSAISGWTSWGPKIKANLFGPGLGMGATSFGLGYEVPEFLPTNLQADQTEGDFPSVQLLNNDGTPVSIQAGVSDAYADTAGNIRVGDWDYLSNGNILIVGESRQGTDLVDKYGGDTARNHAIFRIVSPTGTVVKSETLVSEKTDAAVSIWHGSAVSSNGFAIRFDQVGAKMRLFNNDGTPASTNIDLAALTGNAIAAAGGRGEGIGFSGNGKDAYVLAATGRDVDTNPQVFVAVINANGSLRWTNNVTPEAFLANTSDRVHASIDATGRVIVMFTDASQNVAAGGAGLSVLGRLFNTNGLPLGGVFYVSEKAVPSASILEERRPRVHWRGDQVSIAWETRNNILQPGLLTMAVRTFNAGRPIPSSPEQAGINPLSPTTFLHHEGAIHNNKLEGSLGVAVASNGNVMVGWEDDGADIKDFEAVWTIIKPNGDFVTPMTTINSTFVPGGPIDTRFLAYFRADGSPVSGWTSWGPKIKANLFGPGLGMGATSFGLGAEVPEFAAINVQEGGGEGDFPSVQLVNDDGTPVKIHSGVTDAFAETTGNIRIGDWDYLSNGNILIVGENRQNVDLVDKFGGAAAAQHAIFRILTPAGVVVKAETLVGEIAERMEIWHGSAVTANGFAIRFSTATGPKIRLFNNDGSPASGNIDLVTLVGSPIAGGGGRGEGIGFDGNGVNAYAFAASGVDTDGTRQVIVAVINANGTLKWMKRVTEPGITLLTSDRVDCSIDAKGRVAVVFTDTAPNVVLGATGVPTVMARLFAANGDPITGTFYVSEIDSPSASATEARRPRVHWRNDELAVAYESRANPVVFDGNMDQIPDLTMAVRVFSTFTPGTVEAEGLTRVVPDTAVIPTSLAALGNWEPNASVLGNSHFLIEGNTFAVGNDTAQRYVVRVQPVTGATGTTVEGFYADNGTPFAGQINLSRQNGNPGRVAGDKRPGAVNYIVGGETSAHGFPEFQSLPNRWAGGAFFENNRYGTVQTYALNTSTGVPTPLTDAFDPILESKTEPFAGNPGEVSRFGGEVAALDNGNFVVVTDDRSGYFGVTRSPVYAIITPQGAIVKEGTLVDATVANDQIWSNVAAHKGGFAIRFQGKIRFFDNAGNKRGEIDQNESTETTWDRGRGDGTRIASHINSDFVFLAGGNTPVGGRNTAVKVAAFDARTMAAAGIFQVAESSFPAGASGYDRVNVASDALNRVTVAYESLPPGFAAGKNQTVTRVLSYDGVTKTFAPLTSSFYPFANSVPGSVTEPSNIRTYRPTVAMTTREIMVAAKGEINLANNPALGPTSATELNFYTVFSHPAPLNDPTPSVGGGVRLEVSRAANGNVTLTWTADGFALYTSATVGSGYTKVTTTGKSHTITNPTGSAFFKLGPP